MIPQIKEINFPEYATLSTATASLVDMGDKTITAQVKIDGSIAPDFSYDWEIEFQGERYIQPLREPQASKGNESISSLIDLTFYHKGIYDLKRYFFVSTVELEAGTIMVDNYIVPLRLNIAEFVDYLNNVLSYYYGSTYKAILNPDYEYEETDRKDIDINYTKIWDVVTKIYEWFGVRWSWETQADNEEYYAIKIGYPSIEVSHTFEYGFEGGLLKFERQVQNAEIANVIFGRGSSENIPFRYFKNKSEDNPTFPADPDWIPELENVYFANLRGKTFRDYVKGWKAKHYGGEVMANPTEEYTRGYNDAKFNPIEYVADEESIAKYGEIQKGLEHNEEIKPTIQGVTIEGIGRVDQIVDVEPILVDESTENTELVSDVQPISENAVIWYDSAPSNDTTNMTIVFPAIDINPMKVAHIVKDVQINIVQHVRCKEEFSKYDGVNNEWDILSTRYIQKENPLKVDSISVNYIDGNSNTSISDLANIDNGVKLLIVVEAKVSGFVKKQTNIPHPNPNFSAYTGTITPDSTFKVVTSLDTEIDYTTIHGQILGNYENGATRKSQTKTIPANGASQVVFTTEPFTITEDNAPATSVEMPYRITSSLKGGEYDPRPNVVAINVETGEQMTSLNLPAGTYYLRNSIQITNLSNKSQTFKVELLPTYIYYSYDSASWKPTFDIWVKNIWQTQKKFTDVTVGDFKLYETNDQYASRVWDAILGNHLGDDAKVVFSSGRLSGHSDWEFTIAHRPVYDTSKTIDGVPSEWRITLYKSDAEMEATDKWLPSIMTQASVGDHFYFVGIEMPHQYVLWAEERLDKYKREELDKVSDVDSTIVVQLDKVRLNQLQEGEARPLLNSLRVGNNIKVADSRFIASSREVFHLQSVTYTWDASTIMLPNIEVVLSDEIATYFNPFEDINRKIDNAEDRIKDVRETSLAQTDKAKKSIRNTSLKVNALSAGNANITNQVNVLIGDDAWMSAREIAERVANPIDERVNTLIGTDINKSARTIATEVLAGASTGGDIDLSLYLSKSEAESTYATKKSLEATNDNIVDIDTRLGTAETNISNNSNLLSAHSQKITTLQTEQKSQNDTIKQQGATILALDVEVDGVKGDVSKANKAIESIETELGDKADNSTVDSLSKDLVSTKAVVEIIAPQVNANAEAIKGKASQEEVNALSESVTTLEGSVEEISNRVDNKADKGDVQNLVSQINNKVEQTTYNNKVAELEASIETNKDNIDNGIVYLEGYSERVANEAEARAKTYTDEEIAKVDTKADNALDKADKALADISELDASVKSSFDDIGTTFDTLDSVITGINTTATNALTKATEVEDEVDKLAKDVESNTKTIAEHTEIVTMLNNRCDSIEDTAEELESQISQIETNVTSLDEHIDEVEEKADSALTQLSVVAGEAQRAKEMADLAVATANNVKKKADNNESNIERLGQDVKDVENTLGTLNTTITQVSKKADNAISQAESATTKAEEAKTTATEAKTTANSVSAQMSGVLTQVQNNTTQIGIIAKDYLRKDQAADFATDLTGVIEATPEEFVYRPSAGDKSIRDKSAVIRRIKGNSVVWEQKLKSPSDENANWQGYSSSMLTTEIQGREMRCTLTGASVATNPYQVGITGILPKGSVGGHKYLFCAWAKVSYLNSSLGKTFAFEHDWNSWTLYPAISEVDKWIFISRIWESPQNNNRTSTIRPPWAYTSANGAKAGDWYAIKDAMFFDLTAMFDAGNEPATVEEFRKVYNEAYYPYCQPELRGVKTGAIKTVGFNLFDGNCARVIGGMTYIVSNYAAASYSETKNGTQTAVLIKDGVYTPECSGYLHLTGTADATPCVHFQHSGVMDGECAPYEEHTLNLPEILKLFPNGMHAVGDVFDEINIDTYIQRCEYRDYAEGDESNAEVLTDGVHTVAKLAEPIVKVLPEPITLDYYCEDWGTEEAISSSSSGSAPFRADIIYQFNAEGRIRDNSRNIDKLEKIVAPLRNIPPRDPLATQSFVLSTIPTEVATATERVVVKVGDEKQYLLPNMLYDYGATSYDKIELPNLLRGDVAFNNKWMVRFASISSDAISIPFDVFWKDGIAPSWSVWCVCEMTFFKDAEGLYTFGEWKIYK